MTTGISFQLPRPVLGCLSQEESELLVLNEKYDFQNVCDVHQTFAKTLAKFAGLQPDEFPYRLKLNQSSYDGGITSESAAEIMKLLTVIDDKLQSNDAAVSTMAKDISGLASLYAIKLKQQLAGIRRDSWFSLFKPFKETHAIMKRLQQISILSAGRVVGGERALFDILEHTKRSTLNGTDEWGRTLLMRCKNNPATLKALLENPDVDVKKRSKVRFENPDYVAEYGVAGYAFNSWDPECQKILENHRRMQFE